MITLPPRFPRLRRLARHLLVLSGCAALGCQPSLPWPPDHRAGPGEAPGEPHVLLEPDSPLEAAPPVLRARIVPGDDGAADPSRVLFVRGHVGDAHVRQVENGEVSQALTERILPAVAWAAGDGSAVIAPIGPLDPGATYGILSGDPPLGADVRVAPSDPVPILRHAWPPADAPAGPFAVFCGDADLETAPPRVVLDPGDVPAVLNIGVFEALGARCLRVDVAGPPGAPVTPASTRSPDPDADTASPAAVPPPLLDLGAGALVRLEPAPIALGAPAVPPPPPASLACAPPDIPFGPGCALVADDRLFVTTPDAPLLWAVRSRAAGGETVRATRAGEPWVLHGLTPGAPADIALVALDAFRRATRGRLLVVTEPPMPHVVISEVLANPLGAEPDQEWIELYNDGLAPADLTGHVLADLGGATPLPPAVLAPGAFALVVNETFVEDDEIDPVPAPGTALLRVPELGKDGLKNDGEPWKLVDAGGAVISRFPMAPKPKPGQSLARVSPSAPDGVASSFAVSTPTPGAPGIAAP